MTVHVFRTPYDDDDDSAALGAIECKDKSRTKQEFAEECDINRIMCQYASTGVAPSTADVGTYADFSSVPDFHAAQNLLARSSEQFAALPSKVRARFSNDPAEFLAFVGDKANAAEARALGLLLEEPAAAPVTPAASPPAP